MTDLRISICKGLILFSLIICFTACHPPRNTKNSTQQPGMVNFTCSDSTLQHAFEWAKATALSYVREDTIVGLWYEAALPGRDAFCMRDVSHQAIGAAVLGLNAHTKNMLYLFSINISESKDWCSYWEINKDNLPAPVDYKNDKDFWYNLPANFDVIDACFRMYAWTGDTDYLNDSVFRNFYQKSLTDYADRWELSADHVMYRSRIMNLPEGSTKDNHNYYDKRGIPGYHEGAEGKMQVGIDLLATQYAANNWYHHLFYLDKKHSPFLKEVEKIDSLLQNVFWDADKESFSIIMYEDGTHDFSVGDGQDFSHTLLHYGVIEDTVMVESVLENYCHNKEMLTIELASHMPEIFFRYGRAEDGIFMLKYLTDSTTHRREYPENPFSVTGAFVTGLMGVNINTPQKHVSTFSGFTMAESWGLLEKLPLLDGTVDLLHHGRHTSRMTNHTSDTIFWQPYLEAGPEQWFINEDPVIYDGIIQDWYGTDVVSWFRAVAPGETVIISSFQNNRLYEK